MKLNFEGRTALITGGSGGIGLSIVKKLIDLLEDLKKSVKDGGEVFASKDQVIEEDIDDSKTIKSPIIGTAYLAPEPGAKKFIKIGDKILIMSPTGVPTIVGNLPRQETYVVDSIFDSEIADFDQNVAFINLTDLESLFDLDALFIAFEICFSL